MARRENFSHPAASADGEQRADGRRTETMRPCVDPRARPSSVPSKVYGADAESADASNRSSPRPVKWRIQHPNEQAVGPSARRFPLDRAAAMITLRAGALLTAFLASRGVPSRRAATP